MAASPHFASDIEDVLEFLGLSAGSGLQEFHRVQDLQSFLLNREAVRMLNAHPETVHRVQATLSLWMADEDMRDHPLLKRWVEIVAARDWGAALESTSQAQQLRQASPFAGVLPDDLRHAIRRYVRELAAGERMGLPSGAGGAG